MKIKEERTRQVAEKLYGNVLSNTVEPLPPSITPNSNVRRIMGEMSLKFFLETYFPSTFTMVWSPDHLKIIEEIENRIVYGGLKAIAMPRSSGKTSIILRAALWAILSKHRKFVCIIAANEYAAIGNLTTIKTEINHNTLLAEDFPLELLCLKRLGGEPRRVTSQHYQGDWTGVEYSTRRIDFGTIPGSVASGAIISAAGITGAVRGQQKTKLDGETVRPDLVLVEDPQTKASAASASQVNKRHEIMMGDILGLAGPEVKIAGFATCTVIYKNDLADRLLDSELSPDWNGSKISMIKRWPTWIDGWDEYGSLRISELQNSLPPTDSLDFVRDNYDHLHEGGEVYWEERKTPGDVSALQHAMDLFYRDQGVFAAEYQNSPISASSTPPYEINPERLARRIVGMPRARIPIDTQLITGFIDVQMDLLYYVIMAWTQEGRGYVIDYGSCPDQNRHYWSKGTVGKTLAGVYGDELETFIRGGLKHLTTAILENDYQAEDRSVLQVTRLAIDARWGESTHIIRKFVRESNYRARMHPSMGMFIGANSRPWQKLKPEKRDKMGVHAKLQAPKVTGQRELLYDANFWKSFAADRLVCSESSPKAIVLFQAPPHEHRMFAEHCAYEQCVTVIGKNDNNVTEWRQRRSGGTVENDYWDCVVGNCALASTLGIETHKGNGKSMSDIAAAIARVKETKPASKMFRSH